MKAVTVPSAPTWSQALALVVQPPGAPAARRLARLQDHDQPLGQDVEVVALLGGGQVPGLPWPRRQAERAGAGRERLEPGQDRPAFRASSAARRTARRMRGYVQQRQTLPSRAVLIWSSSGSAFRSSSATVLMIMPAVQ